MNDLKYPCAEDVISIMTLMNLRMRNSLENNFLGLIKKYCSGTSLEESFHYILIILEIIIKQKSSNM